MWRRIVLIAAGAILATSGLAQSVVRDQERGGATASGRSSANAEATSDPRVFVLSQPMLAEGLVATIHSHSSPSAPRRLERGRDYKYDADSGTISLLGKVSVDPNDETLILSGNVRDPSVFHFHRPLVPGSVKVVLGDKRLVEKEGFEVDYKAGVLRFLDPGIGAANARYYISYGDGVMSNRTDLDAVNRLLQAGAPATKPGGAPESARGDPAARALYDQMVRAMRDAESLSFESRYRWEARGAELGHCTYKLWMKKPNFFRMETTTADGKAGGVLIGDGEDLWIHWPNGRPVFSTEDPKAAEETRAHVYMKKPAPPGMHSIAHETSVLGAGMSMTILDPSTFHGYTDSLQEHIDKITSDGTESVGGEKCDVIEVSIMDGQRIWRLWLSRRDHLPRKLRQVVHVSYDITTEEVWNGVTLNAPTAVDRFAWKPPEGWKEWRLPEPSENLLKPGTSAPDFELMLADGRKTRLGDYRGKVVWLVFWRVG